MYIQARCAIAMLNNSYQTTYTLRPCVKQPPPQEQSETTSSSKITMCTINKQIRNAKWIGNKYKYIYKGWFKGICIALQTRSTNNA